MSADSRKIKPGFLFVAIPGTKADGAQFARAAAAAGAAAVAAEHKPEGLPETVAFMAVKNARHALALAAARFFPRQPATIAAVTGTSGKTSVAAFTRQIWASARAAGGEHRHRRRRHAQGEKYGSLTTPDPVELHRTLDQLAGEGITHLALEASSHGLDQHRLDGVRIAAGAFTNLSRDHLDYHPTMEAYLAAKLRLFTDLVVPGGAAVIDVDDCYGAQVVDAAKARGLKVLTVGVGGDDITLAGGEIDGFAQLITFAHGGKTYKVKLPLVGAFQVENARSPPASPSPPELSRRASSRRWRSSPAPRAGWSWSAAPTARRSSSTTPTSPTRWPRRSRRCAPTPPASSSSCSAPAATATPASARSWAASRRKTPTASSSPTTIRAARSPPPSAPPSSPPRPAPARSATGAQAIRAGIAILENGDVLLIAGKGHETGQIVGDRVLPFSDHEAVAAALQGKVA